MADTITLTDSGTVSQTTLPFNSPTGFAVAGPVSAAGGITSGGLQSTVETSTSPIGKAYNYTLVIQIPIPWLSLNLNLNLIGDFVLPALTALGVPQAIQFLSNNIVGLTNNIVNAAVKLIRAIPEASVTLLVKVGPVVVLNIVLVAQKVPVVIPVPSFQLALPDFAIPLNFTFALPFPVPPPVYVVVPVPVPIIAFPRSFVNISGGNVVSNVSASVQPVPTPIANSVYLPQI